MKVDSLSENAEEKEKKVEEEEERKKEGKYKTEERRYIGVKEGGRGEENRVRWKEEGKARKEGRRSEGLIREASVTTLKSHYAFA